MSSPPVVKPSTSSSATPKKTTIQTIRNLYKAKEPIVMVTAHDYPSATFAENAGVDICLVGDSLAMVALGYESTTSISIEEMLHHCRAVARGAKSPFLIGDMPFGSYETSIENALKSAVRFIKEGNMEAVKLEGGVEMAETIHKIVSVGIPVLGHVGLTPQRQNALGGYKVQGKSFTKAKQLIEDSLALQQAGCFAVVLEAIPEPVANYITENLSIPTIGIGAGKGCSGQVLVQLDMIGGFDRFLPKFCKQYANISPLVVSAIENYKKEVKTGIFPADEHCYPMPAKEYEKFKEYVENQKK
ncbi:ketopantoate hydroxymethyltransferase [Paraphysoderma sedebokerense]|nr:ketopantoate hydroxymethyltransferase [Paraphysoderma sedebokerense]